MKLIILVLIMATDTIKGVPSDTPGEQYVNAAFQRILKWKPIGDEIKESNVITAERTGMLLKKYPNNAFTGNLDRECNRYGSVITSETYAYLTNLNAELFLLDCFTLLQPDGGYSTNDLKSMGFKQDMIKKIKKELKLENKDNVNANALYNCAFNPKTK